MKRLGLAFLLALGAPAQGMDMGMQGMYGPVPMTRESSGTSWQPDSAPMEGIMRMRGDWMLMLHGFVNANFDAQAGPRGGTQGFSNNMLMAMLYGPEGPGTFGLRGMFSLEPAMGPAGYPLLLQTGETADGKTLLTDRQHPHDLFMELAATYSLPLGEAASVFAYAGYPGEPALGPPAFMHRLSGEDLPIAPITHHWLDSTHVDFGVATLGAIWKNFKLEGSSFTGREPNQARWDFDPPKFDSYSGRLSWNPTEKLALQASFGRIKSPEQLEPGLDEDRVTASAMYNSYRRGDNWQTTLAWGRNLHSDGAASNALLLESSLNLEGSDTLLGRAEYVEKDELAAAGGLNAVKALSLGYIHDFPEWMRLKAGLGGLITQSLVPESLALDYGSAMPLSCVLFLRLKIS